MLLAIDVGNSTTSVGLFDKDKQLRFLASLDTDSRKTADQISIDLMNLFALYHFRYTDVTGAILCSVVPPLNFMMEKALTRLLGRPPMVVGPGVKTGLNIRADVHNQLGSDIVASAVAAMALYPTPVIVINSHTAVSFSYISHSAFEGCAIMPGMGIALEALSQNGAQLPHISMGRVDSPLGRNTVDSMRAGIVYGYSGAFDRVIETLEAAAGVPAAKVVATGEKLPEIFRHCRREITYDHDLLVHGLYLLYGRNQPKGRHHS